jgi:hypothetical protein
VARRASDGDAGGIEFLTPDPNAFAGTAVAVGLPPDPGPEPSADEPLPAPRRAGIVATVGLLALVAAGTAVVAPWGGDAASPTTSPPVTGLPVTSQPVTLPSYSGSAGIDDPGLANAYADETPGFLVTPSSGLQLTGAFTINGTRSYSGWGDGWGDVWATPGATRTSGRWVAVSITPYGWGDTILVDSVRVDVDGRIGVLTTARDGVSTLTVAADFERADRLLRLEGWGLTPDELIVLAASIGLESDRPQLVDDRLTYRVPELLDGMAMLSSRATNWDPITTVYGDSATAIIVYLDPASERWVLLARLDPDLVDDTIFPLAFTPVPLSTDAVLSRSAALPDDLVIGTTGIGMMDTGSIARWTDPATGEMLLAVGTLEPVELQALVPSARQATSTEWSAARRIQHDYTRTSLPTFPLIAGRGTLADGTEWEVSIDPAERVGSIRVGQNSVGAITSEVAIFDSTEDRIARLAQPDLALVVVRSPGANTVRITTADGVIEQTFTDAAAVVIDALGPYTVDVVDATGQMVDTE